MKTIVKAIICCSAIFSLYTSSAQTEPVGDIGDGDGGVVCECNNNRQCVASGGGTSCRTSNDKCWKSDSNCN